MLYCWCSVNLLMVFFFVLPSYNDPHEHFNFYAGEWHLFSHKIFFKIDSNWKTTLNQKLGMYFLNFDSIFGQEIICFLSVLLLLLLLILRVLFSKLLIIFCNVFRSYSFSYNVSVRYSISAFKYSSEQILEAFARNSLNMLEDIQEFDLFCTFISAGLW